MHNNRKKQHNQTKTQQTEEPIRQKPTCATQWTKQTNELCPIHRKLNKHNLHRRRKIHSQQRKQMKSTFLKGAKSNFRMWRHCYERLYQGYYIGCLLSFQGATWSDVTDVKLLGGRLYCNLK